MASETGTTSLFRDEALRHHGGQAEGGDVLRLSPDWAILCYRVLVIALLGAVLLAIFGSVNEYATGPAVVWMTGRVELTASTAGVVRSVEVRPGQEVQAGATLVRLNDAEQRAALDRVEQEFELQLIRVLRDPSDEAARSALTTLRAQRDLAAAQLEQLVVRAPRAGTVTDVRVREGRKLAPGDTLLSMAGHDERCGIIAVLPGHALPQLHPGTPLRFEIAGYPYAYQDLTIESIGTQVLGPAEVRRYLGPDLADAIPVEGPMILVRAEPPSSTFVSRGISFSYFDGMVGRAEARLSSESLLLTMIPGLKAFKEF